MQAIAPGSLPPLFEHAWFFFAYLFVDALAFPLASTVYVAYFGTHHAAAWTALIGALGTTLGSVVQYVVVRGLVTRPRHLPGWLVRWRDRIEKGIAGTTNATFWALFVIYATPLGAGPLRLVAAAGGFPLGRFALAIFLGCVPYYFALAWFGHSVHLPGWVYAAAVLALLGLGAAQWLSRRARAHAARSGKDPA
jgi:uncharacterized membrane protein YdjX (TVP38/TMEM64 family)